MKRLVAGALAVTAVLGAIWAAQTWATQKARLGAADTDAAVLAADQALRRALASGDKSLAGALIDRRFVYTDRTGATFGKPQIVQAPGIAAGDDDADWRVRRYGRVAVVAGLTRTASARPDTFFVHVWLKRRGGWRAIAYQDSVIPVEAMQASARGPVRSAIATFAARAPVCENPCKILPYRPKNVVEQEIVAAFQAIENAVAANDADAWGKHVADELMIYSAQAPPRTKSDRVAFIRAQKEAGTFTGIGEVQSMQLWTFGDAAVMTAQHAWGNGARLPYRATRIWVRRDGRWQMALSQQTAIER